MTPQLRVITERPVFALPYHSDGISFEGNNNERAQEPVQRLNEAVATIQRDPDFKARLAAAGTDPLLLSREGFATLATDQYLKIGKVVQKAGIAPD